MNVKTTVIPVKIGATGNLSESFTKYLSNIPVKHDIKELQQTAILGTAYIKELQQTAILGTAYILREVLM